MNFLHTYNYNLLLICAVLPICDGFYFVKTIVLNQAKKRISNRVFRHEAKTFVSKKLLPNMFQCSFDLLPTAKAMSEQ